LKSHFGNAAIQANRLKKVMAAVSSVPEGRYLLKIAEKGNVPILFEYRYADTAAMLVHGSQVRKRNGKCKILLNPTCNEKQLVTALCHELRHMWQFLQLEQPELTTYFGFRDNLAFTRLIEADAFVFENFMSQKISQAIGDEIPHKKFITDANGKRKAADWSDPAHQKWLFNWFQNSPKAHFYDKDILNNFNVVAKALSEEPSGKQALQVIKEGAVEICQTGDTNKILRADLLDETSVSYLPHKDRKAFHQSLVHASKRERMEKKLAASLKK
jgi:hypothetical protein